MQNLERGSALTENRFSRNETWCAVDNMCHMCAKQKLDSNFNQVVIEKMSINHEIYPKFTKIAIFKVKLKTDQLLLPYTLCIFFSGFDGHGATACFLFLQ